MNKFVLLVLFAMVLYVSGCPNSVDFDPNAGIVAQDLSFDFPKVYDDEQASLMFDVANVGGKNMENEAINVYVYGPTIKTSGTDTWAIAAGSPDGVGKVKNGYIEDSIASADLPAPDPSLGTPGGRQSFEYVFEAADVLDGMEIPTTFHVSLCYPYYTETLTQVEVTSKNELRATGVRGSRKDTVNAGGPIHLSVEGDGNIRSGGKIPLVFKVSDVGGGFAMREGCSVDPASKVRDRVKVEVSVDGDTNVECSAEGGEVRLKDGEGTVFCTYSPSQSTAPRRTYMVKARATYNYYTKSSAAVTNVGSSIETGSGPANSS